MSESAFCIKYLARDSGVGAPRIPVPLWAPALSLLVRHAVQSGQWAFGCFQEHLGACPFIARKLPLRKPLLAMLAKPGPFLELGAGRGPPGPCLHPAFFLLLFLKVLKPVLYHSIPLPILFHYKLKYNPLCNLKTW